MSRLRFALRALPLVAALPAAAGAQGLLVRTGTASAGVQVERVTFSDDGVRQPGLEQGGDVQVRHATLLSTPFALTIPVGSRLTLDAAGAWSSGQVELHAPDPATGRTRYELDGLTDVRLRATGRLLGDNVLLTLGATLPTGPTELDREQLSALRVLAAPAIGLQAPAVGLGAGGTAGVVLARQMGGWAWALAGSYELRGKYNPVSAFTAGVPAADYDPGDAIHLSLGTEGLVGQHAMTLTVGADLFGEDELRSAGAAGAPIAAVRLGPVLSAEWTLRLGVRGFRELSLFVADRYRTAYEQHGETVEGSSGNYLDAGLRLVRPIGGGTDLLGGLQFRHHTGLDADDQLATASAAVGGATIGLSRALGPLLVQPYLRGQLGTLDSGGGGVSVSGWGAGIAIGGRF